MSEKNTRTKEYSIAGNQLLAFIKRLLDKGNVRRLVILKPRGGVLFEMSLTNGVIVGGVFAILAPVFTALAALAALFAEVRIRVVFIGNRPRD